MLNSDPAELRRLRKEKGHSGRTLALKSGVSQSRISELEAEPTPIYPMTALRLAEALGVEITDITNHADEVETAS